MTIEVVGDALQRVEKDWVHDMLQSLPANSAIILEITALLTLRKEKISTGELYGVYRRAEVGEFPPWKLGERRVLDIVNDLETLGLISTWNVSRGRKGYGKEIRMNVDPQSVLDFYEQTSGFRLTLTRK